MKNPLHSSEEFRFNEVLFESRHKNYGAYVIRNEEGNILAKALYIGVAFFATLAIAPLIFNSFQTPTVVKKVSTEHILRPVDEIPDKKPEVVKPIVPPKVVINTVKVDLPTPKRNVVVQTPATSVNVIKVSNIGPETVIGVPPTTITPPVINVVEVPQIIKPKLINNAIVDRVDVEANFNGGINAFRNKVIQNFNAGNFEESDGLMKTTVTFIVEKDGTISGIKSNGKNSAFNKEAELTIKNLKGKWTPAKLNGEFVRSYFNFPISMQFE